jgi:serine/threonine protein kinase
VGQTPQGGGANADAVNRDSVNVRSDWRTSQTQGLDEYLSESDAGKSPIELAAAIKADLQARFARGQRPAVAEYLDRFPVLIGAKDQVVSLVYEEFCLREECGERPTPEAFCDLYSPWRESLASQLRYHEMLSQVMGPAFVPPKFPEIGDRFASFKLLSMLGKGGAGRVYLALDGELGQRKVALKISSDQGGEPAIQGILDHPHIVPVLSVIHEPKTGLRGLCMPYRPGRPLDVVLERLKSESGPHKARELWDAARPDDETTDADPTNWDGFPIEGSYLFGVAWVIAKLADALAYAHNRGVYHRDVKPANVLMTVNPGPQLLDFNLAHATDSVQEVEAAVRGGTLPYMAPEQLEAFLEPARWENVSGPADLYALGLLLIEMLTGHRPSSPPANLPPPQAIRELLDERHGSLPAIRSINLQVPASLEAIAYRCVAKTVEDRYARAEELVEDLTCFLERRPLRYAPNPSRIELAQNWIHRRALGVVAALVLVILVPIAWAYLSSLSPARFGSEESAAGLSSAKSHLSKSESLRSHIANGLNYLKTDRQDPRLAKQEFTSAIKIEPTNVEAHDGLGLAFYFNKEYEASRKSFERAITLLDRPSTHIPADRVPHLRANYQQRLATVLLRLGQQQFAANPKNWKSADQTLVESLRNLQLAIPQIKFDPDTLDRAEFTRGEALITRGEIALKTNSVNSAKLHLGEAIRCFTEYVNRNPNHKQATERLDEAKRLSSELETGSP